MSDPSTPILSAAGVTAAPSAPAAEAPPVAPVAPAVVAPVATPDAPAAPPAAPPRLNPWARRASAPAVVAAPVVAAPVAVAPVAATAPAAPAVEDPRVATLTAQMDSLHAVIRAQADDALAQVPTNVRATVEALAGDDPARRLDVLRTLRAQGLATAPAQVPVGATTMQAPAAPAANAPSPDASALAQYERLRASGSPISAAAFRAANYAAITRAEAARN